MQLDLDPQHTQVFDSGIIGHQAGRAFQRALQQSSARGDDSSAAERVTKRPCAMVGTMDDFPALELSTLAATTGLPFVVNRAINRRVVDAEYSPYTVQVFPEMQFMAQVFAEYTREVHGRTNYISIVYADTDNGLQKLAALGLAMDQAGTRYSVHPYIPPMPNPHRPTSKELAALRSIEQALEKVKETGHVQKVQG